MDYHVTIEAITALEMKIKLNGIFIICGIFKNVIQRKCHIGNNRKKLLLSFSLFCVCSKKPYCLGRVFSLSFISLYQEFVTRIWRWLNLILYIYTPHRREMNSQTFSFYIIVFAKEFRLFNFIFFFFTFENKKLKLCCGL